jgi:uncharacterized protein YraI
LLATTICRRISYLKNIYAMRQIWFKTLLGVIVVAGLGVGTAVSPEQAEAYQGASTQTGIFVTVVYDGPLNVRSGPGTYVYPTIGTLAPGDVVPALGISPGRDWIQISFPGGPDGKGWVSASPTYVSISTGELTVVEPPPTPVVPTFTIDPTLAAAFNTQPTPTRMPTFTPPPPLVVPTFPAEESGGSFAPSGVLILGLGLLGGMGLLASYILRK